MNNLTLETQLIKKSIKDLEESFKKTLILNPVENIPFSDILSPCSSFLHGLYNTDKIRTNYEKYNTSIQFSGRDKISYDVNRIYECWAELLKAKKLSMRLLSGLNAHAVLFMSLTEIGDKVLILPEKAGGHTSGYAILNRLGLNVKEIPYCDKTMHIDRELCLNLVDEFKPKIIFVDRSEGLVYEDFSWLSMIQNVYKIFDASQYLTNILAEDYVNPFDMGFNLVLSTMHKSLPGPQRAFVCTNIEDENWAKIRAGISKYISNMHVFSIYSAGLLLSHMEEINKLSKKMLSNTLYLEKELINNDIPIIKRVYFKDELHTHHCWIKPDDKDKAFELFLTLEKIGILTNYRLLPYNIGYGLRLGLSGATMSGLNDKGMPLLANIIGQAYKEGYSNDLYEKSLTLIKNIKTGEYF